MSKIIADHIVISNEKLADDYSILCLQSQEEIPKILPGNFAELQAPDTLGVFLRRPFSVYDVDPENRTISFFIKRIGKGTKSLVSLKAGESINLFYPLGNGFNFNEEMKSVLLVGGGSGMAPFKFLSRELNNQSIEVSFLLGGRSLTDVLLKDKLTDHGSVFVTTDDGSFGEKGMVTDHSIMEEIDSFDQIYCCGPDPMMKAIGEIAIEKGVACQVSLETMMACGIGACICCVTPTKEGLQKVCMQGPVFNVNNLVW